MMISQLVGGRRFNAEGRMIVFAYAKKFYWIDCKCKVMAYQFMMVCKSGSISKVATDFYGRRCTRYLAANNMTSTRCIRAS
jgi:hypothetical protein